MMQPRLTVITAAFQIFDRLQMPQVRNAGLVLHLSRSSGEDVGLYDSGVGLGPDPARTRASQNNSSHASHLPALDVLGSILGITDDIGKRIKGRTIGMSLHRP
ncbi:MAG: hypothetical protein DMG24_01650 [Acidobacteria bacterium]|nr:MAG: hypothetical protein DMG24_01650 [Acidobacteriota bacterium]